MITYNHHSARVRAHDVDGMFVADYSGFFVPQAWHRLGVQIESARRRASVSVDRLYSASHDSDDRLDGVSFDFLMGTPPGVWIVRPDQYATAMHVACRLAALGVIRTVFLQALEPLAVEFAGFQRHVSCQ